MNAKATITFSTRVTEERYAAHINLTGRGSNLMAVCTDTLS